MLFAGCADVRGCVRMCADVCGCVNGFVGVFFLPGSGLASARSFVPLGTKRAEDLQKHKDKDRMESVQMMQVGCRLHACTAAWQHDGACF